jgi:Holliday junction resolvase-like predicted endonuclease
VPASPALAPETALPLLLGALLVAAGFWGGIRAARGVLRRRVRTSRAAGQTGEARALGLLERAGYRVVARQVEARGYVEVDGVRHEFALRADALARRWFRRYVVEVKGGEASASWQHRATRRQLLEYARCFGTYGVLLVDAVHGRVHRVRFGPARRGGGAVAREIPRA